MRSKLSDGDYFRMNGMSVCVCSMDDASSMSSGETHLGSYSAPQIPSRYKGKESIMNSRGVAKGGSWGSWDPPNPIPLKIIKDKTCTH